jgi:hypothetical protein
MDEENERDLEDLLGGSLEIWNVVPMPPLHLKTQERALACMYMPQTEGNIHIILNDTFPDHTLEELCECGPELMIIDLSPGPILDAWRHEGIRTDDFVDGEGFSL